MKKWGIFIFLFLGTLLVYKWLSPFHQSERNHQVQERQNQTKNWQAYKKQDSQNPKVIKTIVDDQDRKFLSDEKKAERQRTPAAKKQNIGPSEKRISGRKVVGNKQAQKQELTLINEPKDYWQETFAQKLLDTQLPDTKMYVKHTDSALIINRQKARAVEEVMVTFRLPNQNISSYMAWVDSETGSIIQTWAKTHNHNFRSKPQRFRPTGEL